jgi:hypothetical protein
MLILGAAGAILFLHAHATSGMRPLSGSLRSGWWEWSDQRHYLVAAKALARLDLSPASYWYEPAYSLLAAPFVGITPADPFLIPDLLSYLASIWLFGALGARLLEAGPWDRPLSAALFLAATNVSPLASAIWVVPWTTTPVAPLVFAGLLAVLRFARRPTPANAFLTVLSASAIGAFRPADLVIVSAPAGLLMLWTLVRQRPDRRLVVRLVGAGAAGAVLPVSAALLLHVAIWGWRPGIYLSQSATTGFAWGLVPLRWVLIIVGPKPLLPTGSGLARVFPWVVPGVAGMAACLVAPGRSRRAMHLVVIAAAALECAFLLAYRDLHPTGLWRYNNYHYFKWLLPVFALYALLLLQALSDRHRRIPAFAAAVAAMVGLFCWRPEPKPARLEAEVTGPHRLVLQSGARRLSDAYLVGATGPWLDIVMSGYRATGPDRVYHSDSDFKSYAVPGGFLFIPLRSLPAGLAITFPETVDLDASVTPIGVRQHVAFRLPCWWGPCQAAARLPGRPLRLGRTLRMNGEASAYLAGGWADEGQDGRWTLGPDADLLARIVDAPPGQDLVMTVDGHAYVPDARQPSRIDVIANGHPVARWTLGPLPDGDLSAVIPAADIGAGQGLRLDFHVEDPRSPSDHGGGSDHRRLGLFVRSLRLQPVTTH